MVNEYGGCDKQRRVRLVRSKIDIDGRNWKEEIEKNLTLFLYPDDSDEAGNLLRIYQQYFMVSNAVEQAQFIHTVIIPYHINIVEA